MGCAMWALAPSRFERRMIQQGAVVQATTSLGSNRFHLIRRSPLQVHDRWYIDCPCIDAGTAGQPNRFFKVQRRQKYSLLILMHSLFSHGPKLLGRKLGLPLY